MGGASRRPAASKRLHHPKTYFELVLYMPLPLTVACFSKPLPCQQHHLHIFDVLMIAIFVVPFLTSVMVGRPLKLLRWLSDSQCMAGRPLKLLH